MPAQAIIAALSVQSASGGATKRMAPDFAACASAARSARLAATPPATDQACRLPESLPEARHARADPVGEHVGDRRLEACGEVARRPVGSSASRRLGGDGARAVLRPEKEKSQPGLAQQRAGQVEARRIARRRRALHAGPPG